MKHRRVLHLLLPMPFLLLLILLPSTAEAALICGTSCPSGQHPVSYRQTSSCCSSPGSPFCQLCIRNQVSCSSNSGTFFVTCGIGCPSGYHPTRYDQTSQCCTSTCSSSTCTLSIRNRSYCSINSGSFFTTCGTTCPAGYHVESTVFTGDCCTSTSSPYCSIFIDNAANCRIN